MESDFGAARIHLHRAYDYLRGNDKISQEACKALDLLIEAVMTAECRRLRGQIIPFPSQIHSRQPSPSTKTSRPQRKSSRHF